MGKYLDLLDKAAVSQPQSCEISEISETRNPLSGLNSLSSLISRPQPRQNPGKDLADAASHPAVRAVMARFPGAKVGAVTHRPDGKDREFEPAVWPGAPTGSVVKTVHIFAPGSYAQAFEALKCRCPEKVDAPRWHQAVRDGHQFLARWGEQATALGWTTADLFGLHPTAPLARYDAMGLLWLLRGRPVVAMTSSTAAIQSSTGTLTYYRHNKPALGPLGDSLDDFE